MTQTESIKIWVDGSIDAMDTAQKLFESKKYHHALFFLHLAIEKILKALYISMKDEAPPYIHNLRQISEIAGLKFSEAEMDQLDQISEFNVSARYEEHKYKIYKKATREYAEEWMRIGLGFYELFKQQI